ncbi:MAG TPA: hypothetical protein VLM38_14550, partial [Blastocatellia bacterium]|nr:hypothetical protein [Blastocatellia bacterium]
VEPQNWHLLIESESGSLSAEVPLTLQRLDKPVEYLTIALEKQDKGGRLVVQWGRLALATEFQPAATTASGDGGDTWNELSSFHSLMSQTFHPLEEGNLTPIRTRAA